ncbi:P1 family peptidase [Gehongia tenuis]|uniref:P1 family peptidase n=1 Tax=Gehongia tenuis TaxID=2763655 RepID=A0A926D4V6_9FIRM|nr:P1 family peptidase [Gehongia tenuis]MBC8531502.1 P1 family peptidase [Gehongia tenuis]
MYEGKLTDVKGLTVGHVEDEKARTGCTVVLCGDGAMGGVDVRGAAPGTRETDLLRPGNTVETVHAVVLCGGSAFGLDAASGVMRFLEERGIGFDTGYAKVPIVPAAVLYDLGVGRFDVRPDGKMGYEACQNAGEDVPQGRVGAGCGATVGKILGMEGAMDSGIGTASIHLPGGAVVSALIAVNALGDVVDHNTGEILAGARLAGQFIGTAEAMLTAPPQGGQGANTTIGVVATNVALDKAHANRLASVAHDGLALSIRPVHTPHDGDTLFALSKGEAEADFTVLCAAAAEVCARAIENAVLAGRNPS